MVSDPEPDSTQPARRSIIDVAADRIDEFQRKVPPLAVIHAVIKKNGEDRGGQLAVLLAYKGFFSLFPLLLAFVNALGLILQNNDELLDRVIDSALSNVPVIGAQLASGAEPLKGSLPVLIVSILTAVWIGLGLLDMLQEALNSAWQVPLYDRPPYLLRRLKDLPGALLVAACAVVSGGGAFALGKDVTGWPSILVSGCFAITAAVVATLGLHALLCARKVPLRAQLPGALLIGVGWWGLQGLGAWYVDRIVVNSSDTYGVFVIVFGLLSWSYLLGQLFLYGIELSAVLFERRWPRSSSGRNLTEADHAALGAAVAREARVRGTKITVSVPRTPGSNY